MADPGHHAHVDLVSRDTTVRPGQPARLGLLFTIDPGWHIYWNGYTTTGIPPSVEWTLPEGVTASDLEFPAPMRHIGDGDILDHIYENSVLLPVTVQIPASSKSGESIVVQARVEFLVCKDMCIGDNATLSISLPVSDSTPVPTPAHAAAFTSSESRLPRPMPTDGSITSTRTGRTVTIVARGASHVTFFPSRECAELDDALTQADAAGERLTMQISTDSPAAAAFDGVVTVTRGPGKTPGDYLVHLPVTKPGSGADPLPQSPSPSTFPPKP